MYLLGVDLKLGSFRNCKLSFKSIWKFPFNLFTLQHKVLFMEEQNQQPRATGQTGIEALKDIKKMMERSSRFLSLSGLSGIAAGICAITGSLFAWQWLESYNSTANSSDLDFQQLKVRFLILALVILAAALITAFYFTWRKARHNKLPVWDHTSRRLIFNMLIPFASGGLFILAMLQHDEWKFIAPASLIFYGIALVNASRYTLSDVKYLGVLQIVLGLINTQFIEYGLYFWVVGFGVLHIIYGLMMWWKYEKKKGSEPNISNK